MLVSMASFWPIIEKILDTAAPGTIVEIGGLRGDMTRLLCDWAQDSTCQIKVIEPAGLEPLFRLVEEFDRVELLEGTSLDKLPLLHDVDCFFVDGDHNYYTVYNELKAIFSNSTPDVVFFHDVGWPWGRRDLYYDVSSVPANHVHDHICDAGVGVVPGNHGVLEGGGLMSGGNFCFARHEGGPRNGVLTALEDFVNDLPGHVFFKVDCIFGLGILLKQDTPYFYDILNLIMPVVNNPIISLLEEDRLQEFIKSRNTARHINALKHQIDELSSGSAGSTSQSHNLYLDLLKKSLLDLIYTDPQSIVKRPNGTEITVQEARETGLDWPERALTMMGMQRLSNLQYCVEDVLKTGVPGDLVETGVWRGGGCILMKGVLKAYGVEDRKVWVADSFMGLPPPNAELYPADKGLDLSDREELSVSHETVKRNFQRYDLLDDRVEFLVGWFKDTLPVAPIEQIAVLRLDGDLYESTMDALDALYPKLQEGGYVIIDDYGVLPACRKAVSDYRTRFGITETIHQIDRTGVFWKKAYSDTSLAEAVTSVRSDAVASVEGATPIKAAQPQVRSTTPQQVSTETQPPHNILVSIVVVVYNMQREAPRTLYSLSAEYQDADANQYEVIVVENGSTRPLSQQRVEQMGSNFRYFYLEDAPASPAYAVNFGVQQARGPMVGVMIDGARIVTPGIVQTVMRAYRAYENPLVSTLAWHIGPDIQYRAIKEQGYNTAIEDELLDQSEWMADGYRLFDISTLGGSSADGWLMPTAESNCLFLLRTMYEKLGGFDERFDMPGGGLVNLDFYRRACEYHDTVLIVMLGEGSFHQMHGGIMTNQYEQAYRSKLGPQYREITGRRFQPPVKKPVYWGNIHRYMLPSLQESVQKVLDMDS